MKKAEKDKLLLELDRLKFIYQQHNNDKDDKDRIVMQIFIAFSVLIVSVIVSVGINNLLLVFAILTFYLIFMPILFYIHNKKDQPLTNKINSILYEISDTYDKLKKNNS